MSTGGPNGRFHLLGISASTGKVYTIQAPSFDMIDGLLPSPDNRSIWIAGKGGKLSRGVYRLTAQGGFSTLVPNCEIRLVGTNESGGILGLQYTVGISDVSDSGVVTTLFRDLNLQGAGVARDELTGDLILDESLFTWRLSTHGAPGLTTLARKSAASPWLLGLLGHDAGSDLFLGATRRQTLDAMRVRAGGVSVRTLKSFPSGTIVDSVTIDPAARIAYIPIWSFGAGTSMIEAFDLRSFSTIGTFRVGPPGSNVMVRFATRAGSRHIAALTRAEPGGPLALLVSFPGEPGAAYVAGLSFGMRPGISLPGGRIIYLRADPLLAMSLSSHPMFSGFAGWLDARGEAMATVAIPRSMSLRGLRVFAACMIIAQGQVRAASAPLGITIQ